MTGTRTARGILAAAASTAVLVAACGSGGGTTVVGTPTTAPTTAPPSPAAPSGPISGAISATTEPTPPVTAALPSRNTVAVPPRCLTSDLRATAEGGNGYTYHTGFHLVLTNIGRSTCTTGGFPGVSTVDRAGRQIGAAADRTGPTHGAIALAPGEHASSVVILTHMEAMNGGCAVPSQVATIAAVRVYPSDNRTSLSMPYAQTNAVHNQACMGRSLHVITVSALAR
jgi:hypothetical protein